MAGKCVRVKASDPMDGVFTWPCTNDSSRSRTGDEMTAEVIGLFVVGNKSSKRQHVHPVIAAVSWQCTQRRLVGKYSCKPLELKRV